jgi:hypothetical protein
VDSGTTVQMLGIVNRRECRCQLSSEGKCRFFGSPAAEVDFGWLEADDTWAIPVASL